MRNTARVAAAAAVLAALVGGWALRPDPPGRAAPASSRPPAATPGRPPPNVVIVLTDDQTADSLAVMPEVRRRLGERGTTFTNAFATTPLCCPSRASILTGRYSSSTGVLDNRFPRGGARSFDATSTVATWLRDAGYETSLVGKYLNGYTGERDGIPPGWTDWHAVKPREDAYYGYELYSDGRTVKYGHRPQDYLTTVLTSLALDFIRTAAPPFFLVVAPYAPHAPSDPHPSDAGAFAEEPASRPPSFNRRASGGPAALLPPLSATQIANVDGYRRRALESLLAVDRSVGDIVDALDERGFLDNTLVVYTSDNGHLFGEHRIYMKIWPYEESIRVPMVVRGPGVASGRQSDELVANIDIAPTIAALAGVTAQPRPDGRSLVPLLRGRPVTWRDDVRLEYLGDHDQEEFPPRYDGIRTDRHKLIVWEDHARELYDLAEDPYELENLSGRDEWRPIERDLLDRVLARLEP